MKPYNSMHSSKRSTQAGVALLIAIFALMLISAVAVSLILMSGTGSAIDANYRNSTNAFYSAVSGIEEARGRLSPLDPNQLPGAAGGNPPPFTVSPNIQVMYITNPANGEVVAPNVAGNAYFDNEFQNEWGVPITNGNVQVAALVGASPALAALGLNAPMYKWVRITGLTEQSLGVDIDGNGNSDALDPIFYAPTTAPNGPNACPAPEKGCEYNATAANQAAIQGNQVYRLTSLAVLPDGSRRMVQYDVAMNVLNINVPSPLTLPGTISNFNAASSAGYAVNGTDGSGAPPPVPGCTPSTNSLPAIGVTDTAPSKANQQEVANNISCSSSTSCNQKNYTGGGLSTPSVGDVTLNQTFSTPAQLDQLVQTITDNADSVINGDATNATTPFPTMNPTATPPNCDTVVVNGNFTMSGTYTGCGLLVVTGTFTYGGNDGWDGLILVVGTGSVTFDGKGGGNNQFNGGILVATTKDASGNELPAYGNINFDISGGGGNGIFYNSCWIQNSQNSLKKFKVLSFRELPNF